MIESGLCANGECEGEKVHATLQNQHLELPLMTEFLQEIRQESQGLEPKDLLSLYFPEVMGIIKYSQPEGNIGFTVQEEPLGIQ